MSRANPRFMVGVAVISAFLLVGGPGWAPAIADPGHSGRGDKDNSDRNWGDSRGGSKRGGDDRSDRRGDGGGGNRKFDDGFRGGNGRPSVGNNDRPQTRVGSGRTDIQRLSPGALLPGDNSGSSDRSGFDHPGAPKAGFEPPRFTVGNGRSPALQSNDPQPRWRAPAPEPAPAPPPPPPPPPLPPPAAPEPSWTGWIFYPPPAMPTQLGVAPAADWFPPLWGVAGLLLIPAAGAVLGYRQARAAQDTEKLRRP